MTKKIKDYEIEKELGKGTYGYIYLVTKISSGIKNYYVIKQMNLEGLSIEEKKSFKNEATILSKIKSEFVVKFIESFEENNFFNIVIEYCEGGDLEQFLSKRKKIPLNDNLIWKLFIQIVIGLSEIHKMNILHRDIKTKNIFLTKNNDIKIGDFGISKQLYRFHFAKTVIGTPYYLSPEICKGKLYNEKSDIWALGCVFYELCTFTHPFESKNRASLIKKILEENPKPISTTFDNNFDRIVKQLLQKETKKRPSCKIILNQPYVMKKAIELKLYNKYQKLFGFNINNHIKNEISNKKNSMKKNLTIDDYDKILINKTRPNNNMKNEEEKNSNQINTVKATTFKRRNNTKNKIKIRGNSRKTSDKNYEKNFIDTLGLNLKDVKKNSFLKPEKDLKINEDKKPISQEKISKGNNKRVGSYLDIFMCNNNNKSLKLFQKEYVQEFNLNQMIIDFENYAKKDNNLIYNSPKIEDSEDKIKNLEIRASAFHIYYNEENNNNKVENNNLSESKSDEGNNNNNNKNFDIKEYERNNNESNIENEQVKTLYNQKNDYDTSYKKLGNGNGKNNYLIQKKQKELLNLIGMEDFRNIMQILLFNNENNEKINEITQNYDLIKKEKLQILYTELISLEE